MHIYLLSMIAGACGGTNAMGVSMNERARGCSRCPAQPQTCCPARGRLLLGT